MNSIFLSDLLLRLCDLHSPTFHSLINFPFSLAVNHFRAPFTTNRIPTPSPSPLITFLPYEQLIFPTPDAVLLPPRISTSNFPSGLSYPSPGLYKISSCLGANVWYGPCLQKFMVDVVSDTVTISTDPKKSCLIIVAPIQRKWIQKFEFKYI